MSKIINFILALIKWPCAVGMVALLLPAIKTDMQVVYQGLNRDILYWFCVPMIGMCVVWLIIPNLHRSFVMILRHELTHMLFALLTGHTPKDISIKRGVGGSFSYEGQGNWLIALAPYFFPILLFIMIIMGGVYVLIGQDPSHLYWAIFGAVFGIQIMAEFYDIHSGQTDFKSAGMIFTCLFLPGANLIVYGMILAYVCYGFRGFGIYFDILMNQIELLISLF